jgi:hypothetical protein
MHKVLCSQKYTILGGVLYVFSEITDTGNLYLVYLYILHWVFDAYQARLHDARKWNKNDAITPQ